MFEAHCFEDSFTYNCKISSCSHAFKTGATYASFLTHCNRKHSNWRETLSATTDHQINSFVVNNLSEEVAFASNINTEQDCDSSVVLPDHDPCVDELCVYHEQSIEQATALFLLTLKEKYKLTQASLNFAISSLTNIVNMTINNIKELVHGQLAEMGQSDLLLSSCFQQADLFSNLQTEYQETKYYKENFGLIVSFFIITSNVLYIAM